MVKLTLLRHGESVWNRERRFTGWTDVALSRRGVAQAKRAGRLLRAKGFAFDLCFTSCLKRATETLRIVLETMNFACVPVQQSWCLNERHYGALQGLSRWEAVRKYGARQVLVWQRHFAVPPPPLDRGDARYPGFDPRYAALGTAALPHTESLKDTVTRLLPYWHDTIVPELRRGKQILVVAHGNTLRGLIKYLDDIPDAEVPAIHVPTGEPLVYELNRDVRPLRHYYLRRRPELLEWILKKVLR
ncbi:MAG: 2,3-diphosphoglycerate-dependent phosphoglycerate mutase [Candidatus Binatia bacterium]